MLQQQDIAFLQDDLTQPFLDRFLAAAQGEHRALWRCRKRNSLRLAPARVEPAGNNLNGFLPAGLFAVQAETCVLALGCELNRVILLQTQQIRTVTRSAKAACFRRRSARRQPLSTALQFQHIHVETTLQTTVQQ